MVIDLIAVCTIWIALCILATAIWMVLRRHNRRHQYDPRAFTVHFDHQVSAGEYVHVNGHRFLVAEIDHKLFLIQQPKEPRP